MLKQAEPSLDSASHALERANKLDGEVADTDELTEREKHKLGMQQQTRRRADSLVLMAEALLRDTKSRSKMVCQWHLTTNVLIRT